MQDSCIGRENSEAAAKRLVFRLVQSSRNAVTSDCRNRRCPPGVRIDPISPAFAHLATVLVSTPNISATSPEVSNGSAPSHGDAPPFSTVDGGSAGFSVAVGGAVVSGGAAGAER